LALTGRGLAHLRRGELDGSIADFDAALVVNPTLADSLYARGIAKRRKGDLAGADADLAAAKAIRPGIAQEFATSDIQ
jgi:tetratricopeptide (TPR) repeat protein